MARSPVRVVATFSVKPDKVDDAARAAVEARKNEMRDVEKA